MLGRVLAVALVTGAAALAAPGGRVVAIGDVHGDLAALRSCLRVAGLVDRCDVWTGGESTLVSCGDVLDRGDDDWDCLEFLDGLRESAAREGGAVHLVLGNHEVLNLDGDVGFASRGGLERTGAACDPNRALTSRDDDWLLATRTRAFTPGSGRGARMLADLCGAAPVALKIGETLFCHGGLHVVALTVGAAARRKRHGETAPPRDAGGLELLDALNADAAAWLRGRGPRPPALSPSPSSPVWSRSYSHPAGSEPGGARCSDARAALETLGCARMVVGHTPQINVGINAACGGAVYRIDTGLSREYGGPKEVLDLTPGQPPKVLSASVRFF